MTRTLLIPDIHGDSEAALRLMRSVGALDANYERVPGWRIVQLGDLVDGREETRAADSAALALVEDGLIDTVLVGNHEYPFLGGKDFAGFEYDIGLADRLYALQKQGKLVAALAHGDTLITHAGLTPFWRNVFEWETPYEAAKDINRLIVEQPFSGLFAQIGRARGDYFNETGGILWSDFEEPRWLGFNQIHGHTFVGPQFKHSLDRQHWALVLDNGGGKFANELAGAILEGNEVKVGHSARRTPEFVTPLFDVDALDREELAV